MKDQPVQILLADDDPDDRLFFKEAVEDLPLSVQLTIVEDGGQLMKLLNEKQDELPDILFLDLNMPRKNGRECLVEIKRSEKLKRLPVIIYTTSLPKDVATLLYNEGAHYYIRKPIGFDNIRTAIHQGLIMIENNTARPSIEEFMLTGELFEMVRRKGKHSW